MSAEHLKETQPSTPGKLHAVVTEVLWEPRENATPTPEPTAA